MFVSPDLFGETWSLCCARVSAKDPVSYSFNMIHWQTNKQINEHHLQIIMCSIWTHLLLNIVKSWVSSSVAQWHNDGVNKLWIETQRKEQRRRIKRRGKKSPQMRNLRLFRVFYVNWIYVMVSTIEKQAQKKNLTKNFENWARLLFYFWLVVCDENSTFKMLLDSENHWTIHLTTTTAIRNLFT